MYETTAVSNDGHMIPLLTCIGNHEAMYSKFNMPRTQVVPYLLYLSHRVNETVDLNRSTYHMHELGANHTSLMILDSSVIVPHDEQVDFIDKEWVRANSNPNKLVAYHAPLYPSYRDFYLHLSVKGRYYWEPLFNKHKISVCMEHHDHSFKRSVVINNGTSVSNSDGIVYVGDGAMGVTVRSSAKKKWWIATNYSKTHVWLMRSRAQVNGGGVVMDAYDTSMNIFDSVTHVRA